ncbi:MAG TPA: DUF222 domain-containing protein [Mycobacteriales bacterium]|nr:DUF222 domain-containing protein [Mycobacteriales bacterium]
MRADVLDQLASAVDALIDSDPHDSPDCKLLDDTARLIRLQRRLDGALARRLQVMQTRQSTTNECAMSTRSWLIDEQLLSAGDAGARLAVARSSVTRPAIVDALVAGDINHDHAKLITTFLPKLPDAETRDLAEGELIAASKYVGPTRLAQELHELADKLCLNETAEERAVRKREGRYLNLTDTIDQMVRIDGMLDRVGAALLRKALYPLALKAGELEERTPPKRNADALVELAKLAMRSGDLPETAGEPTQVVVTTSLAELGRELQPGESATSTLDGTPHRAGGTTPTAPRKGLTPRAVDAVARRAAPRGPTLRSARSRRDRERDDRGRDPLGREGPHAARPTMRTTGLLTKAARTSTRRSTSAAITTGWSITRTGTSAGTKTARSKSSGPNPLACSAAGCAGDAGLYDGPRLEAFLTDRLATAHTDAVGACVQPV